MTIQNSQEKINIVNNLNVGIKFHGNSVTVQMEGPSNIYIEKYQETYICSKILPNVSLKNVIIGTKR